ncbi:uncharacterized protein LOC143294051 [Babylonia areolata]|uniref:uncharacterized protein LOC143294051 n=1 Tax=Babylonia areolata TaxID=304850 RepID=UPI003FD3DBD6
MGGISVAQGIMDSAAADDEYVSSTMGGLSNVTPDDHPLSTLQPGDRTTATGSGTQTDVMLVSSLGSTWDASEGISDVTTAVYTPPTLSATQRGCRCVSVKELKKIMDTQKPRDMVELVQSLMLKKDNLSATRRRYTSAPDSRHSSQMMGVVGIVVCALPLLFTLLIDFMRQWPHDPAVTYGVRDRHGFI